MLSLFFGLRLVVEVNNRKNLVRENQEKERVASLFGLCWLASFLRFFGGGERGLSLLSFVPPGGLGIFERIFNALI